MKKLFFFLIAIPQLLLSQVGIGTNSPNGSAKLEINSNSKGMLMPRMTEAQRNAISGPATGLMVYQTNLVSGIYFYSGSEWILLSKESTKTAAISSLDIANATLEPSTYTSGVSYTGALKIPYTGGNGGSYASGSSISSSVVTGLSASLKGGSLNYGTGELVYNVSGTPSASSPNTASFTIPATLSATGGTATVGAGKGIGIGEAIVASYKIATSSATSTSFNLGTHVTANNLTPLPTIDGLEINIVASASWFPSTYYIPVIYNRASSSQIISLQTFATEVNQNKTLLNTTLATGAYVKVDVDDLVYWTTTAGEVITTNVQVPVGSTFRWYEFKWWCMEVGTDKVIFVSVVRKM